MHGQRLVGRFESCADSPTASLRAMESNRAALGTADAGISAVGRGAIPCRKDRHSVVPQGVWPASTSEAPRTAGPVRRPATATDVARVTARCPRVTDSGSRGASEHQTAACRLRVRGRGNASSRATSARKASLTDCESGKRRARAGSSIRSSAVALAALVASRPRVALAQSYRRRSPSGSFAGSGLFILPPFSTTRPCDATCHPRAATATVTDRRERPRNYSDWRILPIRVRSRCRTGRVARHAPLSEDLTPICIAASTTSRLRNTPCVAVLG